jgi:hypothetical protein
MRTSLLSSICLSLTAFALVAFAVGQEPEVEETLLPSGMEEEIWSLGDQEWDFTAVTTVYMPVKGTLDDATGTAVWTLEIARSLSSAEAAAQGSITGSPFKPVLLDEERVMLTDSALVQMSPISGRIGDRVKVTFQLPKGELSRVKSVRVERRTPLGF